MIRDLFFIHADLIRNCIVLLCLLGAWSLVLVIAVRVQYRKKAYREAKEYLKQEIVEARLKAEAVDRVNARLLTTVERLTQVQNAATGAANTIKEAVKL